MASKLWRIASSSLSICLSAGLGGCLSLTVLDSSAPILSADPGPVSDLHDDGLVETPRLRQSGNGVDPLTVLAHRTNDRMRVTSAAAREGLPAFAAAASTSERNSAVSRRRFQTTHRQVSNAEIAKRDRQAEVLIRQSVRSICQGCQD